jgi:ABC-type Fe3+/spermidine/putrescine transport system ATPase subunit/nucleotide-binding universal stress UspA family protein
MKPGIEFRNITKSYVKNGPLAVKGINFTVPKGTLTTLLGPSGCGKTTTLRMIAGLESPSSGQIRIDGTDVTAMSAAQRQVSLVFQSYALFPHMNVFDNVGYGLSVAGVGRDSTRQRVAAALATVGLGGYEMRWPGELSGGQQQRVALARALAYEPGVLLLDEPFGALDVKIRGQLRRSLKEIQRQLKVTTILVTHDQEEAFELADRIGVMEHGRLVEVGSAEELYARPRTLIAATFLGGGNVLVGRAREGQAHFGALTLPIPADAPHEEGARVQLLFRPEQVELSTKEPGRGMPVVGQGSIVEQNFTGPLRRVRLRLPRLPATRQVAPPVPFGEVDMLIDAVLSAEAPIDSHELWVGLRAWQILRQPPPRLLIYDSLDGSTAHLNLAQWLAERWGAAPTVVGVAKEPAEVEDLKAALKRRQTEAGLAAGEPVVRQGNPFEQIANEQTETLYDMLVLSGNDPVDGRANRISAITLAALERPDVPVLVVKGKPTGIERILICTAAGEPGKHDVRIGGQLAYRTGAAVSLLYVARKANAVSRLTRLHLERAAATVRALDVPTDLQIREANRPVAGILSEARTGNYDLIVMGSRGPQSRSAFAADDITLQIVAGARHSVLVVPPER